MLCSLLCDAACCLLVAHSGFAETHALKRRRRRRRILLSKATALAFLRFYVIGFFFTQVEGDNVDG